MNNAWKINMLTFITFLLGTSNFVIVGILDKVAASVGVSVSTAGQLITAFSLANAIGTPIVMVVTAKMDQRKRLLLALAIMLLGIVLIALPGFGFLMVSRVVLGVGNGVFVATAYSLAPKLASAGREVGAMSNVALGFSASLVFGVPIGRVISAAYDWKVVFWGIGFLTLLGIFAVARKIPAMKSETPVPLSKQLTLLREPRIAVALGVTLFVFISYSVVNTYITPFLTSVVRMSEGVVSIILLALGIASIIGSKLGGFVADRTGTTRTLVGGMAIQAFSLVLLSFVARATIASIPLLMLWMIAAWTFVPPQNFNLVSIAPEASSFILSLNNSFVQLGFAAGAAIGGITVGGWSIMAITWIGAASVTMAAIVATISFGYACSLSSTRL